MSKYIKLKAIAILVCSGIAGGAIAAGNTATTATPGTTAKQPAKVKVSDATVSANVNSALSTYSGKVKVTTKSGIVSLVGELPSDTDYDQVITLVESTKGVADVNVDKLTVKDSSSPMYDTYVTAKVKGYLIQSDLMGKDIPSWTVKVETKDGQVFLSGNIATQQEKDNVLKAVKSVKGVSKVNDKIVVGTATDSTGTTATPSAPAAAPATTTNPATNKADPTDDDSDDDSDSDDSSDAE